MRDAAHPFRRFSVPVGRHLFPVPVQAGAPFLDSCEEQAYNHPFVIARNWVNGGAPTMDKKRLEYYKKKLQTRREELIKTIARTEEEGRTADDDPTVDLADKAANSYTKEFLFGQTNTDRSMLL